MIRRQGPRRPERAAFRTAAGESRGLGWLTIGLSKGIRRCLEIGRSVRTTNCLEECGIFTVEGLLNCTRDDLLSISNFGEKTLEEVYLALEGVGFYRPGRQAVGA